MKRWSGTELWETPYRSGKELDFVPLKSIEKNREER